MLTLFVLFIDLKVFFYDFDKKAIHYVYCLNYQKYVLSSNMSYSYINKKFENLKAKKKL